MQKKLIILLTVSLITVLRINGEMITSEADLEVDWRDKRSNDVYLDTQVKGTLSTVSHEYHKQVIDRYGLLQYTLVYSAASDSTNTSTVMPTYNVESLTASYYDTRDQLKYEIAMAPVMQLLEDGDLIEIMGLSRNYMLIRVYVKEYFTADANSDGIDETYTRLAKNDLYVFRFSSKYTIKVNKNPVSLLEVDDEDNPVTRFVDSVELLAMAQNRIALKLNSTAVNLKEDKRDSQGTGDVTYSWKQNLQLLVYDLRFTEVIKVGDVLTGTRTKTWTYYQNLLASYKDYGDDASLTPFYDAIPRAWKAANWHYDYAESYDSNGKTTINRDTGISDIKLYD